MNFSNTKEPMQMVVRYNCRLMERTKRDLNLEISYNPEGRLSSPALDYH